MPSTWTAYSKRKSTCKASDLETIIRGDFVCLEAKPDITEGLIIVRVREGKITADYHTRCWLYVAMEIMLLTPYAPKGKGRRKLPISDEEALERRKLSSRYSAFQSRVNEYSKRIMNEDLNSDDLTISISIMRMRQDQLWYGMKKLGGAPERWRVPNGHDEQRESNVQEVSDESTSLSAGVS